MKIEEAIKQNVEFRSKQQRAIVNLLYTTSWLQSHLQDTVKQFGVSLQQYNVLRILRGQKKVPCPLHVVKTRMLDRQSDVSRIVDRLVEKNLVLRSECQRDRRKVDILISDSGIELLAEIESKLDINEPQTMALNDSEAEQLSNLLDQVRLGLTGH